MPASGSQRLAAHESTEEIAVDRVEKLAHSRSLPGGLAILHPPTTAYSPSAGALKFAGGWRDRYKQELSALVQRAERPSLRARCRGALSQKPSGMTNVSYNSIGPSILNWKGL